MEKGINQDNSPILEKQPITTHEGGEAVHDTQNKENTDALLNKAEAILKEAEKNEGALSPETVAKVEKLSFLQKIGFKEKTEDQKIMLAKADFTKFLDKLQFGITKDTEAAKEKVSIITDFIASDAVLAKYAAEYGYDNDKTVPGYLKIVKKGLDDISGNAALLTSCVGWAEEGKTDRLVKFLRSAGHAGHKSLIWNEEKNDYDVQGANISGSFIAS